MVLKTCLTLHYNCSNQKGEIEKLPEYCPGQIEKKNHAAANRKQTLKLAPVRSILLNAIRQ